MRLARIIRNLNIYLIFAIILTKLCSMVKLNEHKDWEQKDEILAQFNIYSKFLSDLLRFIISIIEMIVTLNQGFDTLGCSIWNTWILLCFSTLYSQSRRLTKINRAKNPHLLLRWPMSSLRTVWLMRNVLL
jgi:hypothetical protein